MVCGKKVSGEVHVAAGERGVVLHEAGFASLAAQKEKKGKERETLCFISIAVSFTDNSHRATMEGRQRLMKGKGFS